MQRTSTIFSCPKSYLFSAEEYSTFEEWVAQDITDDYGPLRQEHEYVLQNESNTFSKSNRYAVLLDIFSLLCFALFLSFILMSRYKTIVLAANIWVSI